MVEVLEEFWNRAIAVNPGGTFLVTKYTLPSMIANRYGRIINTSSVAGLRGFPGASYYAASKHGIIGFTKSLAQEVAQYNITANVVCPGHVDTPMLDFLMASSASSRPATSWSLFPDRPSSEPSEVAGLVLWLASNEARSVTGACFTIDQDQTAG